MKNLILTLIFLATCTLSANAQLSILLGTWEMKTEKGMLRESWHSKGDSLSGISYKYNLKGDSTLLETVIIKKIGSNTYFCVTGAQEDKSKMVKFKLISSEQNLLVFENKTHDFPQRIYYKKVSKTELLAWIEGKINGKAEKISYHYQRKL